MSSKGGGRAICQNVLGKKLGTVPIYRGAGARGQSLFSEGQVTKGNIHSLEENGDRTRGLNRTTKGSRLMRSLLVLHDRKNGKDATPWYQSKESHKYLVKRLEEIERESLG